MPRGKKYGGRNFAKGVSGNYAGRPVLPDDLKGLRERFNKDLVEKTFIKYMLMNVLELEKISKLQVEGSALLSALDHIIIQVIIKAGMDADTQRLNFLLDRTIGKVVDKSENMDYKINLTNTLDKIPEHELVLLLKRQEEGSGDIEGAVLDV